MYFLQLNPVPRRTLSEHVRAFDFLGLFLVMAGVVLLVLGFNSSQTSWRSAETIAELVVGGVVFILGIANEFVTKRSPIIPPRLFMTRTTGALLYSTFVHGFAFFAGSYCACFYTSLILRY